MTTTVDVTDPIYQVLWEHVGTRLHDGKVGCRCGICLPNIIAHLQHLADVIRMDSPTEKCIRARMPDVQLMPDVHLTPAGEGDHYHGWDCYCVPSWTDAGGVRTYHHRPASYWKNR